LKDIDNYSAVIANYEMVCRSLQYQVQSDETIIDIVETVLNNGTEITIEDDEFIEELSDLAFHFERDNTLKKVSSHFKDRKSLIDWISKDSVKAAYALAADKLISDSLTQTQNLLTYGGDIIILDEGQAVKNPNTITTQAVNILAENIPRLIFMTGTLIENRYDDITIPLRYMDPEFKLEHPDDQSKLEPKIRRIRQALIPFMSRYTREDISPRTYNITPEHERTEEVEADEVMHAVYRAILSDTSQNYVQKLKLARLATLHPGLAINKIWQMAERDSGLVDAGSIWESIVDNISGATWTDLESGLYVPPKYKSLVEIIENTDKNMLVFTSHIEGNTRPLEHHSFPIITAPKYIASQVKDCTVFVHDGQTKSHKDIEKSERGQILRSLDNVDRAILFASYKTLGLGYDLTKTTYIVTMDHFFQVPVQAIARSDRVNQTEDVTVKYQMVTDKTLSAGTKSGLTVDQSVYLLGLDKQTVNGITVDGNPPGPEEYQAYKNILENGGPPHNYTNIRDSLKIEGEEEPIDIDERQQLNIFIRSVKSLRKGSRNNVERFEEALQDTFIRHGVLDPTSYPYKSNQMVGGLLENLDNTRICDVGGGPALLYFDGKVLPYDIIDPVNWKEAIGRVMGDESLPKDVTFFQRYLSDYITSEFPPYEIVIANNMIHWTSVIESKEKPCERELYLRDLNKTLIDRGKLILGLPGEYADAALENLAVSLEHTGFGDFSTHQVQGKTDKSFHELITVAKKISEPSEKILSPRYFNYAVSEGRTGRKLSRPSGVSSDYNRPTEVNFIDDDGFTPRELGELLL